MSDMKKTPPPFASGDVVQIIDEEDPWFGCLLVVKEPKATLFQGFVLAPASNDGSAPPVQCFRRPHYEQVRYIGRIALEFNDDSNDTEES